MKYIVKYQHGTYSGKKEVFADDKEHAIAKVKKWVNQNSSLSMAYESYSIIDGEDEE